MGDTYQVGSDGKAQSGLKAGDKVVTAGGTYTINSVNKDGSYNSSLTDKGTTTKNYSGSYANSNSSGNKTVGSSSGGSSGSGNKNKNSGSTATNNSTVSTVTPSGKIYQVGSDGKAQKGLSAGDQVVTGGGTYTITGVNADGSYQKVLSNANQTTKNYNGTYANAKSGSVQNASQPSTTTSTGRVYQVGADGKAPSGLSVGDQVVTAAGTYTITGNNNGQYTSELTNSNQTTKNYTGTYANQQAQQVTSAQSYSVGSVKGIVNASTKLQNVGDTWTDSNGAIWTKVADNKIQVSHNGQVMTADVQGSAVQTSTPNGSVVCIVKDLEGNVIGVTDTDGNTDNVTGGLIIDPTTKQHIMLHKNEDGTVTALNTSSTATRFADEEGKTISANGLSSDDVVLTSDAQGNIRVALASTGEFLTDVYNQYGLSYAGFRVEIDGRYYDMNGNDVTDTMPEVVTRQQWTQNEIYDELLNALRNEGYLEAPLRDNYQDLTFEQALAQASNQLGASYDQSLNSALEQMHRNALQSGFYGQLPEQALIDQAVASSLVDKQSAIYNLANELVNNSRDYGDSRFEADNVALNTRLNTLNTLLNTMYQYYADEASSSNDAEKTKNTFISNMVDLILEAYEKGIDIDTVLKKAQSLYS